MNCPNCKKENKNTNIICTFCNTQLINISEYVQKDNVETKENELKTEVKKVSKKNIDRIFNLVWIIFFGPFILFSILIIVAGVYNLLQTYQSDNSENIAYILAGSTMLIFFGILFTVNIIKQKKERKNSSHITYITTHKS